MSEGRTLNESKAQKFSAPQPPFTLSDVSEGTVYSFAVRAVTLDGYQSALSEVRAIQVPLGKEMTNILQIVWGAAWVKWETIRYKL